MPVKSLFPTRVYTAKLAPAPNFERTGLNTRLLRECRQLALDDGAGRAWSRTNYPGGYTSYSSASRMHQMSPTFAQLQKRIKVWEAVDLWAALYPRAVNGDALLERLGLADKQNAWFMTLSGGQKQRLFIALALIHDPEVVLLDELTTGLDPQARRAIWELVGDIRRRGATVFLTTHLMEEAERLCDRVAIIDHGRIVDIGTPGALVRRHCPERTVVLTTDAPDAADRFRAIPGIESVDADGSVLTIRGRDDDVLTRVIQCLADHRMRVIDVRTDTPTLEDVFLRLTGHRIRD